MSKSPFSSLRILRDSIHECLFSINSEDLQKIVKHSRDVHENVKAFSRLMRYHGLCLDKRERKVMMNILDMFRTLINSEYLYKGTVLEIYEKRGFELMRDDLMILSSF